VGGVDGRGGRADLRGRVTRHVDHRVESAPAQRRQIAVAITAKLFQLRKQVRVLTPAIEQRDTVPARQRGVHDVTPDEDRPAEDEEV
jgi:hypothetical protein